MEYWQLLRQHLGQRKLIIPGASGAIVFDGKVLLVRHATGQWHLPGGLQELGESIQQTVEREIREEVALTLECGELISLLTSPRWDMTLSNGDELQAFQLFFRMHGDIDPAQIRLQSAELSEHAFFDPTSPPPDTLPCCRQKLADLLAYEGRVFLH